MRVEKPLLGFGWMGWVLLAIAGALVVVWVTGYDLQLKLLSVLYWIVGDELLYWFTGTVYIDHALTATTPAWLSNVGLWALCAVLIACQVYPERVTCWRLSLAILWCLIAPIAIGPFFKFTRLVLGTTTPATAQVVSVILLQSIVTCAVLKILTRSWWVFAGIFGLYALTASITVIRNNYSLMHPPAWVDALNLTVNWAWNPTLLAILLAWAIPARIRYNRWWLCAKCRYDMRDLGTATCPECGTVNERMPAPDTGAVATDS